MSIQQVQDIKVYKSGAWHSVDKVKIYKDAAWRSMNAIAKGGVWYQKLGELSLSPINIDIFDIDLASPDSSRVYYAHRTRQTTLDYSLCGTQVDTNHLVWFTYASAIADVDIYFTSGNYLPNTFVSAGVQFPASYVDARFQATSYYQNIHSGYIAVFDIENKINSFTSAKLRFNSSGIDANHTITYYLYGSNALTSNRALYDSIYNDVYFLGANIDKISGSKEIDITAALNSLKAYKYAKIRFIIVTPFNFVDTVNYNVNLTNPTLFFN